MLSLSVSVSLSFRLSVSLPLSLLLSLSLYLSSLSPSLSRLERGLISSYVYLVTLQVPNTAKQLLACSINLSWSPTYSETVYEDDNTHWWLSWQKQVTRPAIWSKLVTLEDINQVKCNTLLEKCNALKVTRCFKFPWYRFIDIITYWPYLRFRYWLTIKIVDRSICINNLYSKLSNIACNPDNIGLVGCLTRGGNHWRNTLYEFAKGN